MNTDEHRLFEHEHACGAKKRRVAMTVAKPRAAAELVPSVFIRVHAWFQSKIQNPKSKMRVAFAADVSAVPLERVPENVARGLVQDDEVIILLLRPSFLFVFLSSLGGLAFIAVVTLALAYMTRLSYIPWRDTQVFALGFGFAALRLGWQTLEWVSRVYILTDRRVITRSGVLRVVVFQTQLRTIQHTTVFFRLRERLCGLGTIGFATAGSDTFESFWVMISDPYEVHRTVVDAIRRYGK
jgi:hypothetical protein